MSTLIVKMQLQMSDSHTNILSTAATDSSCGSLVSTQLETDKGYPLADAEYPAKMRIRREAHATAIQDSPQTKSAKPNLTKPLSVLD